MNQNIFIVLRVNWSFALTVSYIKSLTLFLLNKSYVDEFFREEKRFCFLVFKEIRYIILINGQLFYWQLCEFLGDQYIRLNLALVCEIVLLISLHNQTTCGNIPVCCNCNGIEILKLLNFENILKHVIGIYLIHVMSGISLKRFYLLFGKWSM